MREIKFRAWNTETKEYVYQNSSQPENFPIFLEGWKPKYTWVIEQFTGLFDKNGKEIYENDWVEWDERDEDGQYKDSGIVVWDNKANGWKIEYIFNRGGKNKYPPELWFFEDLPPLEVIGNKHDNPELLK